MHNEIADIRAGRAGLIPEAGTARPHTFTERVTIRLTPRDRANGIGTGGGRVPDGRDHGPRETTTTVRVPAAYRAGIVSGYREENNR